MDKYTLTVNTFKMGTEKESALKPLEEAAEIFGAWQGCGETIFGDFARIMTDSKIPTSFEDRFKLDQLACEIADCIQACCNLAARYGIDLRTALEVVEMRNRDRGRYEQPQPKMQPEMTEGAKRIFDRLMKASGNE